MSLVPNSCKPPCSLNSALLQAFIDDFYGYGDIHNSFPASHSGQSNGKSGGVWFVGMEEGGGQTCCEICRRLGAWRSRGRPVVDNIAAFHHAIGLGKWFPPPPSTPPTQTTWREIIRAILVALGNPSPSTFHIAQYQASLFGRSGQGVALLELLPLPAPSTGHWPYSHCSTLPILKTRSTYMSAVLPKRIARLKALISTHKPRSVVFYGASYQRHWQAISGCSFGKGPYPRQASSTHTSFFVVPHPAARPKSGPVSGIFAGLGLQI
jgi:hypothetical protein